MFLCCVSGMCCLVACSIVLYQCSISVSMSSSVECCKFCWLVNVVFMSSVNCSQFACLKLGLGGMGIWIGVVEISIFMGMWSLVVRGP